MEKLRLYANEQYHEVLKNKETAENLEKSAYEYACERLENKENENLLMEIYKQIYMKVISNIKLNKNKEYILKQVSENKIKIEDIPKLSREDLYPEKWETLYTERTDNLKVRKVKGMHKCPKCKSWFTVHQEMQTRSCDESSTIHITCLDCNYSFKYS